MKLYGFQEMTVGWFRSFMIGRAQRIKIGAAISSKKDLESGVPQGGILSPLIFVTYVSDLDAWLKWSTATTYADDTTTGVADKLEITECS